MELAELQARLEDQANKLAQAHTALQRAEVASLQLLAVLLDDLLMLLGTAVLRWQCGQQNMLYLLGMLNVCLNPFLLQNVAKRSAPCTYLGRLAACTYKMQIARFKQKGKHGRPEARQNTRNI